MQINVIEYFERTFKKHPERVAVYEGEIQIDFGELNRKIKVLAQSVFTEHANVFKKPIAVFLPKSINSVIADIAIIYSGNFYMNLDIKSPETRISAIIGLIQPSLIITDSVHLEKLGNSQCNVPILNIDEVDWTVTLNEENLFTRLETVIDTDPSCIINTSGSTGVPKGVVLNHKSFIDFTEWAVNTLEITENEIVGSLSPLVFDIYSFELCMLMARGSTLVLIPESFSAFPANILRLMNERQASFIFWVPTIMVNIANMDLLSKLPLPFLKTVWFAGEVFPTKQFNYWRSKLNQAKFVNLYGPIEITLDCTYYVANRELRDDEPIPIGFPCRNTDILILTENDQIAKQGEEGELCVRGTSLAMGYYNNPEKTAAAFIQNPLNKSYPEIIYRTGDIVTVNERDEILFKGRKDSLIKHLGYRIELAEIEHVIINSLKLVENGCVVYNRAKKEITLFYEFKDGELDLGKTRVAIGNILPKYMIPGIFIKMDELPRNTNGKIDRLLLSQKVNE